MSTMQTAQGQLDEAVLAALPRFGVVALRAGQREAVDASLRGDDALILLPTGAGKSLCYQLPAAILRARGAGPTLVVSPLLALMDDQAAAMRRRGQQVLVRRGRPRGAAARAAPVAASGADEAGACAPEAADVILVSPEKAATLATRRLLVGLAPSRLVVDEAHCVSAWGHDFRPEFLKIAELRALLERSHGPLPTLALTATAAPAVRADVCVQLGLRRPVVVRAPHRRANLALAITPCTAATRANDPAGRMAQLRTLTQQALAASPDARVLVYVPTRKRARSTAESLRKAGVAAEWYHAGRTELARARALQQFDSGRRPVLCATTAFGMGVDRGDVRLVVHAHAPASATAWLQEAGRAGRDGGEARAVLLFHASDGLTWAGLRLGRKRAPLVVDDDFRALTALAEAPVCRWQALARAMEGVALDGSADVALLDADRSPCGVCDVCHDPSAVSARWDRQRDAAAEQRVASTAQRVQDLSVEVDPAARSAIVAFVGAMPRPVGAALLTLALRGSQAKAVRGRKLDAVPGHGALRHLPEAAIRRAIADMQADGALLRRGRRLPTVWLPGRPLRGVTAKQAAALAASPGGEASSAALPKPRPARRRRSRR